jgi:hypothetical protein
MPAAKSRGIEYCGRPGMWPPISLRFRSPVRVGAVFEKPDDQHQDATHRGSGETVHHDLCKQPRLVEGTICVDRDSSARLKEVATETAADHPHNGVAKATKAVLACRYRGDVRAGDPRR